MKERVYLYGRNDRGDWDQLNDFGSWADAGAAADSLRAGTYFAAEGDAVPSTQEYCIAAKQPSRSE